MFTLRLGGAGVCHRLPRGPGLQLWKWQYLGGLQTPSLAMSQAVRQMCSFLQARGDSHSSRERPTSAGGIALCISLNPTSGGCCELASVLFSGAEMLWKRWNSFQSTQVALPPPSPLPSSGSGGGWKEGHLIWLFKGH